MKTLPSIPTKRLLALCLVLSALPVLLAGCGGLAAISGGGARSNVTAKLLNLGPSNYDLLTNLTPLATTGWYSNPIVTPVTINTTSYADALKAAVYADTVSTGHARYYLGGQYSALALVFGVTADEAQTPSWTAFRFYGDGVEIATPHYVKKYEKREVFIDVRGVNELDLIAEGIPQHDGVSYVSTLVGWGDGTLIKENGISYLADLTPTGSANWVTGPSAGTIWIDWRPFPHSVMGTIRKGASTSTVTYHLGGAYKSFATVGGMSQNETDTGATVTCSVYCDGVPRASATVGQQAEFLCQQDVTGVNTLELRMKVASSSETDIDVGWGMALTSTN